MNNPPTALVGFREGDAAASFPVGWVMNNPPTALVGLSALTSVRLYFGFFSTLLDRQQWVMKEETVADYRRPGR